MAKRKRKNPRITSAQRKDPKRKLAKKAARASAKSRFKVKKLNAFLNLSADEKLAILDGRWHLKSDRTGRIWKVVKRPKFKRRGQQKRRKK